MTASHALTRSQYALIAESLPDPTFILSESGRYVAILGGKDKRYYHDGSSLLGKYLGDVLVPAKAQWFLEQIHEALDNQQMLVVEYGLSGRDVKGLPPDGPEDIIWFEGRISPLPSEYGPERAVVWVASNITASKLLQQQLQQQAMTDELTGLHNRRHFMQALARAYVEFMAQTQPYYLISFDVDHFKAINDELGHIAGDQALRDLAQTMRQMALPGDLLCRFGGDEFAILCWRPSMAEVTAFARCLLEHAGAALQPYANKHSTPSLSLGVAQFQATDTSMEDIIHRADQALYISKKQGGHRISTVESKCS